MLREESERLKGRVSGEGMSLVEVRVLSSLFFRRRSKIAA